MEKVKGGTPQRHLKPIEQLYLELKDEYKEYRRRAVSLEQQRRQELEVLRNTIGAASGSSGSPGAGTGAGGQCYDLTGYYDG